MLDEVYEALLEQKRRQDLDKEKYKDIYQDQGFVFADCTGNFLAQRPFMNKYHKFLKKYNIQDIRFHDLRHTFASLLIEQDVSMKVVQELLGHSTITTSMDIYTHISDKKKEEAMQLIRRKK
ncbi:tyrosine-type recombinase/integrase [Roseburia intestinalis]|jgi:integrase|uniref:tyrosine-type recombinase/integrase n=1 Tax=Roseburia intestinalis TaxID=166486 RepID=UPI00351F99BD